jgi:hypothetical protein
MKSEMTDFLLYISGYSSEFEVLHMRAPHGQTLLNPRPLHPHGFGYATHPELSRPFYAAGSAYAFHNPYVAGVGVSVAPAVLAVMATFAYPEVAGFQYQSAISGHMSIGGGGYDLIYGNHERGSLSAVWNYFAQNF